MNGCLFKVQDNVNLKSELQFANSKIALRTNVVNLVDCRYRYFGFRIVPWRPKRSKLYRIDFKFLSSLKNVKGCRLRKCDDLKKCKT